MREDERKMEKEEEEEDDEEGGWRGWTVVVASFFCIAILDGVGYTTGIKYSHHYHLSVSILDIVFVRFRGFIRCWMNYE